MARKFLTSPDLGGLELLGLRLENRVSAPSSPQNGYAYYDTSLHLARVYIQGSWFELGRSSFKEPCRTMPSFNHALSGLSTIDGHVLQAGDRVLVRNQTNPVQNGIYIASSGAWTRAPDFDSTAEVTGAVVGISSGGVGSIWKGTLWQQTAVDPVVGTDPITFYAAGTNGHSGGTTLIQVGDEASPGTSGMLALVDHQHPVGTPTTPAVLDSTTGATGASTTPARQDHRHEVSAGTPGSSAIGDSVSAGASTTFARADHIHGREGFSATVPVATSSSSGTVGVSTSPARSDHRHGFVTATPVTLTPDNAASAGAASSISRSDHRHGIVAAAPTGSLSAAGASSEGTSSSFARADHNHAIADDFVLNTGDTMTGDLTISKSLPRLILVHPTLDNYALVRSATFFSIGKWDGADVIGPALHMSAGGTTPFYFTDAANSLRFQWESSEVSLKTKQGNQTWPQPVPNKVTADVGDGAATSFVITHNMNTRHVKVEVYRNSTPWDTVIPGAVERTSLDTVTVSFASIPTANEFTVLVVG